MNLRLLPAYLLTIVFFLAASTNARSQAPADLFISEYIEGSSNNKALEFYNGTGAAINLTTGNYVVQYYSNGSSTAGLTINLTGTVASNSVFILAHASATFITANGGPVSPNQTNNAGWYNGNDAVVLRKGGASGPILDVIGQVGFDPGTEWGTGLTSTSDNSLRRKASDCSGDVNASDAFDPATKYDGFATNAFDALGAHTSSCVSGPGINVSPTSLNFITSVGSSTQQSYTVQGTLLTNDITITVPALTEFGISLSAGGPFNNSIVVTAAAANAGPVTVFVRFAPTSAALQAGNLAHVSGAFSANVSLQGGTSSTITPVYTIQGSSTASSFDGSVVTTEGIVTADFQGANQLDGFFIQDTTGDGNSATSDGIFVFNTTFNVTVGDYVRLTAEVDEFNSLTELKNLTSLTVLSAGNTLKPPAIVALPVSSITTFEAFEGMRVQFSQVLTATETFNLGRFGEVVLSANGRRFNPTDFIDLNDSPATGTSSTGNSNGTAVTAQQDLNNRSRIILDDDANGEDPAIVPYLNPADTTLRLGSTVSNLTGIMDYGFGEYRIRATQAPAFAYAARSAVPSVGAANVKVASFNVLNYFNGNGSGGGFPTARGANTPAEFNRQRTKIINAIKQLNADVVGLIEIENDGSGAISSIADLVNGLNAATAPGTYALVADPAGVNGNTGTDEIRQAIIYKPGVVTPVGLARADMNAVHNRPPVAQTFTLASNGEKFTVIVNHFKSKSCSGASGANADQFDGQACFNASRKQQASALLSFIATIQASAGDADVIAVGDFNAYEQEDPIDILRAGGLIVAAPGIHSYVFEGQTGSLDYAILTPGLAAKVTGAGKWHINSDEPRSKDYNQEFNAPYMFSPNAFRSSDHDPVLVGLNLGGTITNAPPVVNISSPANNANFTAGSDITIAVNATDGDGIVKKVEFYYIESGVSIKLAEDTTLPFSLTGNDITAGNYPVYVKAYDNLGATGVSDTINIIVTSCTGAGSITAEGFGGIPGSSVADLTGNANFPNNPSITVQLGSFEIPENLGDQYGVRIRGYICAPQTGNYTFYIASDEQSELWLSTDDNPANKVRIAFLNSPVAPRTWTAFASQKSAPITLIAGARYYIEALHKENAGNDNLAIGWVKPDGTGDGPIPGNYLSPWVSGAGIITGVTNEVNNAGTKATLSEAFNNTRKFTVLATPNPATDEFTLRISSGSDKPTTIIVRDIAGRMLAKYSNQTANGTVKTGAGLAAGIYFVEVAQGDKSQTLKLIKK
jgi:uncharacterized protein